MVSRNLNPAEGFYLDPTGMTLPVVAPFTAGPSSPCATTAAVAGGSSDDPSKKVRKPYTITKSRESWTEPEHDKFLEALQLFDRDWKKIEAFIGSKTVIQIRSHAQKYFLKVQKTGTGEHLPPPRPKRKAAHPYPQKAPQNAQLQGSGSSKSTSSLLEPGYAFMPETSSMLMNSPANSPAPSWTNNAQTISFAPIPKGRAATNNNSSSSESTRTKPTAEAAHQGTHAHSLRVLPDFSQVYCFIGSVFDPCASNHLQKLKEMDPIDVETVLLLMRNLSINLTSPDFEDHRKLLSMYEIEETNADPRGTRNKALNEKAPNIAA